MNGITVVCPNSRRCVVKVTPSTRLRKVLEEACLKQGFDISMHQLRHQNHTLDLALPLRLSGLPNNATVEMISSAHGSGPIQIQVALQLADGTRLMRNFSNKTNLLDILHEFSQDSGTDLVKCSDGRIPCCADMSREYRGEAELKSATLETMGITSGRCLIRYSAVLMSPHQLSELESRVAEENARKKKLEEVYETRKMENERRMQLETEREKAFERELEAKREAEAAAAIAHAQQYSQNTAREMESPLSTGPSVEETNENSLEPAGKTRDHSVSEPSRLRQLQSLLDQVNSSLDSNAADFLTERLFDEHGRIHIRDSQQVVQAGNDSIDSTAFTRPMVMQSVVVEKCERMPVIVRHDPKRNENKEGNVHKQNEEIDDQFFELTVNDVQSIRRDLRAQAGLQEQQALLPKTFVLEKNKQLKEESYKHTVVRFNFSDRTVLQAQFISREPVSRLFEFISENLTNRDTKFDLHLANQRISPSDTKDLIDIGIAPKSSLYIKFHSSGNSFAAHFVEDKFCEIPMTEADELSRDWLSVNSTYRPFDPKVVIANDMRPSAKRQPETIEDGAGPSKLRQQPSGNVPKWFKKP